MKLKLLLSEFKSDFYDLPSSMRISLLCPVGSLSTETDLINCMKEPLLVLTTGRSNLRGLVVCIGGK